MAGISAETIWVRVARLGFGLLTLAAVFWQLAKTTGSGTNFFSFFTIQSNVIGAVVLLLGAVNVLRLTRERTLAWDLIRGGAAIYLTLTGVVYNTLLTGLDEDLQTVIPWVNNTLHKLIPIVLVIDFILIPLVHKLTFRKALIWSIYPLAYLIYTLVRGPIVDWYPYPFLDPRHDGGYWRVAAYCIGILIGFMGTTWLFVRIANWRSDSQIQPG
ncbi:MAG TPA: Pr6Pr family membrane protein [Thermomicrobiales bacterium]|nr:Pr6Pr family membrane protein [Thermomicrobiales bacterium]HRA47322.1 Pr6Pr family membrane protein [Thermomicrobiales bacterium]